MLCIFKVILVLAILLNSLVLIINFSNITSAGQVKWVGELGQAGRQIEPSGSDLLNTPNWWDVYVKTIIIYAILWSTS